MLESPQKYKYNTNIILTSLLEKHFKEEYESREKEEAEEEIVPEKQGEEKNNQASSDDPEGIRCNHDF